MSLYKRWLKYKKDFKENYKNKIDDFQDNLRDMGWYASSFKSFGQLGKFIETTWQDIRDDQKAMLLDVISIISFLKIGLNILRYLTNSIYNGIQIRESIQGVTKKRDIFNNAVRLTRIVTNFALIALSIVAVVLFAPAALIAVAAIKFFVRALNMVKTTRSYIDKRSDMVKKFGKIDHDQLTLEEKKQKFVMNYGLKKREWRFLTRGVSLVFSAATLAVVITAFAIGNPMLIGLIVLIGLVALITTRALRYVKDRRLNTYRLKPKYYVYSKKELLSSHQKVLKQIETIESKPEGTVLITLHKKLIVPRPPKSHDDLINEKIDIEKALVEHKWHTRMNIYDYSLLSAMVAITVVGIVVASPIFFIGIALLSTAILVGKVLMHSQKYKEMSLFEKSEYQPKLFASEPSLSNHQPSTPQPDDQTSCAAI